MSDDEVTHKTLFEKLVEHEGSITLLARSVTQIEKQLHPIARGINSIAFAFKGLLALGAICAAVLGILKLSEYLQP
jgi:hypothetical protein